MKTSQSKNNRSVLWLVVAALAGMAAQARGAKHQEKRVDAPEVAVHLEVLKKVLPVGESLPLRFEILNKGTTDIFVGKHFLDLANSTARLELSLKDRSGWHRSAIGSAGDYLPDSGESFASALVRDWLALPPGGFYGATAFVSPAEFPQLLKPGRYCIQGKYISAGVRAPVYFNALRNHPDEIARLPYDSFVGELRTNSVWIQVIGRGVGDSQKLGGGRQPLDRDAQRQRDGVSSRESSFRSGEFGFEWQQDRRARTLSIRRGLVREPTPRQMHSARQ